MGRNYIANVNAGDLWYFPPGMPHSLQGLDGNGTEFLLVCACACDHSIDV